MLSKDELEDELDGDGLNSYRILLTRCLVRVGLGGGACWRKVLLSLRLKMTVVRTVVGSELQR